MEFVITMLFVAFVAFCAGGLVAVAAFAVAVVRAASAPPGHTVEPTVPTPSLATASERGGRASVDQPGGDEDAPRAIGRGDPSDERKTRQKARCALCEAVRAALGLTGRVLAGKK